MLELLSYGFMQRALISSIMIGVICSVIGVFVVLKGLSFIGAGTAHAAFAGVALAYLINVNPFFTALIFSLGTVWTTGYLQKKGKMKLDASIGIFYAFTMALAILFIGLMKTYNPELYGYLFGSILSVTSNDLLLILSSGCVILLFIFLFYKEFHFITFDQDMAEASGIPSNRLFFLLLNLIALTIVISLQSVGALLIFAMLLIPPSSAYQLAYSMRAMIVYSILIGVSSAIGGVLLSYWLDMPSGAAIVLLSTSFFFISVFFSPKRERTKRQSHK
ncbi:MAG: metal ABC transporter permease [Nitrospirota bacterium]